MNCKSCKRRINKTCIAMSSKYQKKSLGEGCFAYEERITPVIEMYKKLIEVNSDTNKTSIEQEYQRYLKYWEDELSK